MARRKSSKSSFNSLVKQPYFFAAVILIAVVAIVLLFAGSGQTAKFYIAPKTPGTGGTGLNICYSNADCQPNFHCEYTTGTKGKCVKTPPPCTDLDKDGYGAKGTDLSGCVDSQRADCRDDVFHIHPGAKEKCGNRIDEDCSGADLACPQAQCTDTDGGKVDSVQGNLIHSNGTIGVDRCLWPDVLQEWYCDASGNGVDARIDCAASNKVCANGACV